MPAARHPSGGPSCLISPSPPLPPRSPEGRLFQVEYAIEAIKVRAAVAYLAGQACRSARRAAGSAHSASNKLPPSLAAAWINGDCCTHR